jgi:hypothetical protein
MNRNDIIAMARDAGAGEPESLFGRTDYIVMTQHELERFAALVAAAEQEACAKICEARYMGDNNREDMEARRCAAAIRAAIAEASMQRLTDVQQEIEQEPVAWEAIEKIAQERYKVGPSDTSMFYRFAVLAGNGTQHLYIGREIDCQNMARKFAGAFLDGAFLYEKMATPPRREWVGLTDGEKENLYKQADAGNWDDEPLLNAVEAKLKEKNT